ncbi:MAG: DUF2231 domain-containing protein [Fimbriimonadaceae bacterium]|nr:DUF2231 domain-containing protein [Fimbriimonadaceae bacterium]
MDSIMKLFPEHGFHPLLVHFPIALFIFGTFLEVLGLVKKNDQLQKASGWNLVAGALMALVTVPSGFVIFFNSGYAWQGIVLTHAILAGVSTILMLSTAIWKIRKQPKSVAYSILLVISTIAVGATGHFGGQLIYGS